MAINSPERSVYESPDDIERSEGASMPIERWRSSIPEIYKLRNELASGKGFVKAAKSESERIHRQYGQKTKEVTRGKKQKNDEVFGQMLALLRYEELLVAGFDKDDVEFETSSIRREIKEFFNKKEEEKTDKEKKFENRLDTPIEYSDDSLIHYEDRIRFNPELANGRSAEDYRRSLRAVRSEAQDEQRYRVRPVL